MDTQHMRNACVISLLMFMCGSIAALAAPATLTQSVTYNSETITMQLTKEYLRGGHFELLEQNSSGGYDTVTPVDERSYIGTVDEHLGAVSCGILKDDGTFWGVVYFDRGVTWFTLGTAVYETRALDYSNFTNFQYPTAPSVATGQAGTTMYAFDVGIDADYYYYAAAGSTAAAFEQIEFSTSAVRTIYMRDALLQQYLGRVIIRASLAQDPYEGASDYLGAVRTEWNTNHTGADRDLVASVSPTIAGSGVAWVGVVGTSSAYSINGSNAYGDFSIVWRHEMGHNWSNGHYVGNNPEGAGIMGGNAPGRFSGCEVYKVLSHRDSRLGIFDDLGTYTAIDIPPYAALDATTFTINTVGSVTVDVLGNDYDANGDSLTIAAFDPLSKEGAAITLSSGTGPGGRDELIYTPLNKIGTDSFYYTIVDSLGQTASGVSLIYGDLGNTLKGYWDMDETSGTSAGDSSILGNNATAAGGLDFGTNSTAGQFGNAVTLDGVDDFFYVSGLNIYSNTVTLTAWIKRNGTPSGWNGLIFSRANQAAGLNFGNSTELRYHWNDGNWGWNSGLNVPNNTWTFVALVIEPSKATIYMNDGGTTQSAVNTATHNPDSFAGTTYIGRDVNAGRFFNGSMDDVRIYDYSLTATQIEQIIAGGAADSPDPYDGKTDVDDSVVSWSPGATAINYDVYVGTSQTAVANATQASPEYQDTTTQTSYTASSLDASTTYFWRVDTVTSSETITGYVWTFTTSENIGTISQNIMMHLTMDTADITGNTIADTSGAPPKNGTIVGSPGNPIGQIDEGLAFTADGQYVNIGASNIAVPWTVSTWVKRTAAQTYSHLIDGNGTSLRLEQWPDTTKVGFTEAGVADYVFDYTAPLNTWVHLVFVGTASETELWVNGSLADSVAASISCPMNTVGSAGASMRAIVDDLAAWERNLDSAEIGFIYQEGLAGRSFKPDTASDILIEPISGPIGTLRNDFTGNLGMRFRVDEPVSVSELAYYDHLYDGLAAPHTVRVYESNDDGSTGTVIATATIPAGTAAQLSDGFRWVDLPTPVTLSPQTGTDWYVLAATVANGDGDSWYGQGATGFTYNSFIDTAAGWQACWASNPGSFPDTNAPVPDTTYYAYNMALKKIKDDTILIQPDPSPSGGLRNDGPWNLGMRFRVDGPVSVNELAYYNHLDDGLAASHTVRIYESNDDGATGTVIAAVTIPAGTAAQLSDGFRWMDLASPVALTPQTGTDWYVLTATVANADGDPWYGQGATGFTYNSFMDTTAGWQACYTSNPGAFPGTDSPVPDTTYYAFNMGTANVLGEPPAFNSDPFTYPDAAEGADYDETISTFVTDPDVGDVLTFTKETGPAWLNVATDGQLSGVSADGDVGLNEFTIRVTDLEGLYDEATMRITVNNMFTGELGLSDLLGIAANWLDTSCGACGGADLDGDGDNDMNDWAIFSGYWLK